MNKKGFTLVELLATIVVLAVVALIGFTAFGGVKEQTLIKNVEDKLEHAVMVSKNYGLDKNFTGTINFSTLVSEGYLESSESNIKNDVNGKDISFLEIKIYNENRRYQACIMESGSLEITKDKYKIDLFCN